MVWSAVALEFVSDEDLLELADEGGPGSIEAQLLKELRNDRARDRQYFAFRVGEYCFTGPVPDARTEAELLILADLVDIAS